MNSAFCIAASTTGREFDNLTGLHYYRARWYDASVGRFISEDPIGFAGGDVNLYGYVGNSPGNFLDPYGLDEYAFSDRLLNQQDPEGFRRRERMTFSETADEIQLQLAIYGLIPGIGEPFDLLDGGISLIRGDFCSASLSAASAIPFLGSGAGVIKIAKRADNAVPRGGVYKLIDPETGAKMRGGRTNDLARRRGEHARDPQLKGFPFRPIYRTDDNDVRRGLEQLEYLK